MKYIKILAAVAILATALPTSVTAKRSPSLSEEISCLATNIYFEARGETIKGQLAVALVTINRTKNDSFPDTICGVIHQKTPTCQFTWYCDSKSDKLPINNKEAQLARLLAITALTTPIMDITHGALYFNSKKSKHSENVIEIGNHVFYGGS